MQLEFLFFLATKSHKFSRIELIVLIPVISWLLLAERIYLIFRSINRMAIVLSHGGPGEYTIRQIDQSYRINFSLILCILLALIPSISL